MKLTDPQLTSLAGTLAGITDQAEMKKFLRDLLTENEINEFARRWEAAQLLAKKTPYTAIVKQTGLSSATVARISRWLQNGAGGYRLLIDRAHHGNPSLMEKGLS